MQYHRKDSYVEARQHDLETTINVDSIKKGMQTARKGDFLVVDPSVEEASRDQSTSSRRLISSQNSNLLNQSRLNR